MIRLLHNFLASLLSMLISLAIVVAAAYFYMELQLPNVEVLKDVHMQVPLRVYSKDNKLIAEYGSKKRIPVNLDEIPKPLINAVLATEDQRFYSHSGVDFVGMVRAAKAVMASGRKTQGASTITMQVARNFFLSQKKTYLRKVKEILLAIKIESKFSKDKILDLYLNQVYFGNHAYGVAAAAQVYYGKKLNELALPEMAMIAGLPQAPSRNNPLSEPELSLARRNHVLQRMLEVGYINQEEYVKATHAPQTASYHGQAVQLSAPYLGEMVRQLMVSTYGELAYEHGFAVYTTVNSELQNAATKALQEGLIAYSERHGFNGLLHHFDGQPTEKNKLTWQKELTALQLSNPILQPGAVISAGNKQLDVLLADGKVVQVDWSGLNWIKSVSSKQGTRYPHKPSDIAHIGDLVWLKQADQGWRVEQIPKAQGALVSLDPLDGSLQAVAGGFDFNLSKFNRVVQAERQPGSSFKPFIYSAALSQGYTLASLINDAPVVIKQAGDKWWRPHNENMQFYGPTRLREGLVKSRNLVSIRLLQQVGIPYAVDHIGKFGFDINKIPHSLSLALGTGEVTPLQLTAGYAVFANGGYKVLPYFIDHILDQKNETIFQAEPPKACIACITDSNLSEQAKPKPMATQVLALQDAYLMNHALQGVIQEGTGRAALVLNRSDLAGKTGTTNKQRDAWFSGFNQHLVTTVWIGFDNLEKSVNEYGSVAALPIWINFMKVALANIPEQTMPEPSGMITVRIDPVSGQLASSYQESSIFEIFREDNAPTEYTNNEPNQDLSQSSSYVAGDNDEDLF